MCKNDLFKSTNTQNSAEPCTEVKMRSKLALHLAHLRTSNPVGEISDFNF